MGFNQNQGANDYAPFKVKQQQLTDILVRSADITTDLDMIQPTENLKKLQEKVKNDTFKIQIVGTFKNGKSTFINSFLGEEILPAYTLPCTAVINEVKYGEKKRAVLHFCNPMPEDVRMTDIPERAFAHMKKHGMKNIPPMEIPYDEIESYVVIPKGKDPKEAMKESPFEKVELFWPMELLKNGVEIIDSPGLNEAESRTKVTMEYLTKADAIIFLLTADRLCSQDEMNFVEYNLKGNGFESPFFVVNKFDIPRKREKEEIKDFAYGKLEKYTTFGRNGFYFVSAINALDGKIEGDKELYESSGMPAFEKRLAEFLTKEKGIVKLSQPAREVKKILSADVMYKVIPENRALLDTSLDDLKNKYENVKPQLKDLQTKKALLKERLDNKINMALPDIRRCVTQHIADLCRSIPVWCEECEPETKIGMIPSKEKIARAGEEVANHVSGVLEKAQVEWKNNTLSPLITEKIQGTFDSVEADVQKMFDQIDSIHVEMTGEKNSDGGSVPTWQRVAGAVGGLVLGGPGLAFVGGANGIGKDFAKALALELGAFFALSLFGLLNPVTLIATILGVVIYGGSKAKNKANIKIKEEVANQMIAQLNSNKDDICDGILKKVHEEFDDIAETVIKAVDIEINEVDNQIKSVMAELEKGQANIDKRKEELKQIEAHARALADETDDFVDSLVKKAY